MSFPVKKLRDSLDDEDVSDDVDDEVFIRDGRTFKLDDDRGLKRPLMAPRRKFKSTSSYFSYGESSTLKRLRAPFCVTLLCVIILCCLIALALILINMNTSYMLNKLMHPSRDSSSQNSNKPCTDYEIEEVWHVTLPKIKTDTPVRKVDVNSDGYDDVIIGYGTGADHPDLPLFTCQMYFGMPAPCAGGVLALDGRTGELLWRRWLQKTILKLDCSYDVTQDGVNDCLVSGERELLCIINGKTGYTVWCLSHREADLYRSAGGLPFYAGQFIPDVNHDGVVDVITAHTNESSAASLRESHVVILSGATGDALHRITSPVSGEMMLSAPHILVKPDGEAVVIFCTVHNNAPTSIYVVAMSGLINGESERVKTIYSDIQGLVDSPILIDMNGDQTEDIVVTSKSKLLIFDGLNYTLILNVSYPFDDSYEHFIQFAPVPGYFNNDTIPDFFLTYSVGSTEYVYYSVSTVLDGKTGKSLLPAPIIRSNIPDTAGITLSSPGYGQDAFIYWLSSCVNFENYQDDYKLSGPSFEVDICNARFNTSTEIKLMLLSQYVTSPGVVLYSSSANFETEINGTTNVLGQVEEYIELHPEVKEEIAYYQRQKLASSISTAKCAVDMLQRSETPDFSFIPEAYGQEIIPDPVARAYPRERYPPQYPNIDPADFPLPDEDTRDRDERDENTKREDDTNLNDVEETVNSDLADVRTTNPDKTRNVVKDENKSVGSKEVMPRKKRTSNKISPRRKRKIGKKYDYEYGDRDENHGGEEFDETENRKDVENKEKDDDNQGGETMDDYEENYFPSTKNVQDTGREMSGGSENKMRDKNIEDMSEERFVNVDNLKRNKRHKEKEFEKEEGEDDDTDDEEDEEEGEDEDDNDEEEEDSEEEDEPQEKGEREQEEESEADNDEPEEEEDEDEENEDKVEREPDERSLVEKDERLLSRNKRNVPESYGRSFNVPSNTRHKFFNGPNHKKKTSMQEKWWKYIMMTNSEDWQMKKKSILKEENKLKEDKRKLEERQGNTDGTKYMQNRTKELKKRNQQLKEEEERVMKHIPSKKMINLDEQFLNYVKKSLGLKNNDSSISNYDVDDVEELWDDFIETNVLNHRGFEDDYEFDVLKDKGTDEENKDDPKKNRLDLPNNIDFNKNNIYHYENPKQMVSYNLHADNREIKPLNDSIKEKLVSANHTSKRENNNIDHIVDENDLQKFKHFTTLDQLKIINRMNKNNKTKHNRIIKNEPTISTNNYVKKSPENMTNNYKHLKVILKNGENFKYNDYYKWKDNSEYVNFDSYYNLLKISDGESNELSSKKQDNYYNNTLKHKIYSPAKLFSSQSNQSINCNSYYFKKRIECENNVKTNPQVVVQNSKNDHSTKKQKLKKIHKKLHEKIPANLGIKHIVVNDTSSDNKGQEFVIEKINYKFPFNFGKERIYSEKDLEFIFNNETHSEIKKIMKLNFQKINDSISKIKNSVHNKSDLNHWTNVNYYKSHKLIRTKSDHGVNAIDLKMENNHHHINENEKHINKTSREIWFNTLHSLKNNKQFLKHAKSSHKSNRVSGRTPDDDSNTFNNEGDSNNINILSEQNADLITKKIDLQNTIEKIHISELKNSKNKTHKLFPYRRRDKDKTTHDNRIENLFGLTDNMITNVNLKNKTENNVLGLPVGGKYSSHLNWHEKSQYGLPLKNKWETTTEILANSQRHHRLLKVKKRSIQREESVRVFNTLQHKKRSTVKKDLSKTLIVPLKTNHSDTSKHFQNTKPKSNFEFNVERKDSGGGSPSNISDSNDIDMNKARNFHDIGVEDNKVSNAFSTPDNKMLNPKLDAIVKRSVEKYLKILPRATSTPILMNSIVANDSSSIDIIFVSFWVPPKTDIKKLTKSQLECVRQKVLQAESNNCYREYDDLLIEEEMAKQCIRMDESGGQPETRDDNIQFNPYYLQGNSLSQFFNPFNLRFGQLSVYRIRIKCKQCEGSVFEMIGDQGWPSGNGQMSNGVFVKKREHNK